LAKQATQEVPGNRVKSSASKDGFDVSVTAQTMPQNCAATY